MDQELPDTRCCRYIVAAGAAMFVLLWAVMAIY